jgi:RNA polymerase sigma-70 factor (ECF subfamily)
MRWKKPHLPLEEESLLSHAKNTMKKLEARLQLGEVARAMRRMGETERMVLSLVCVEGMSYRDAAEIMEVPVGTVMSRLARARKKLHRLISEKANGARQG